MTKKNEGFTIDKITPEVIAEYKKEYDFDYIRKYFYVLNYKPYDLQKDILAIAAYNQDLSQISAIGPTTTRVTNYYVTETQCKASSVSAMCDPDTAVHDDVYLTKILHRLKSSPHFFSRRTVALEQLRKEGLTEEILTRDTSGYNQIQLESYKALRQHYIDTINLADLREVRNAISHIPSFHKVSQFPNHAAAKIYERYCPKEHGVILDMSSGWGNRLMATLTSKYHYKYLGTDPNSEMHNNYRGIADLVYKVIYKDNDQRQYPNDFFDIRDQGSEFDIPEWHSNSGYEINEEENTIKNKFTDKVYTLNNKLQCEQFIKDDEEDTPMGEHITYHWEHPNKEGYGINDTGKYHTSGAKLPPIWNTHDEEIFNSGVADLSFSSPPYFFLETYTKKSHSGDTSDGQSAGKGSKYTDWLKDFVYPSVVNHFNYLKPGGYYIYNLKDLPNYGFYIYSDFLSICLDVGFELIEQPELILKSRRHIGSTKNGQSNRALEDEKFTGATEKIAVLRKPLHPNDTVITSNSKDALYHIQHNFQYNLIKRCRPTEFTSKLPTIVQDYLENYRYNKDYQYQQKEITDSDLSELDQVEDE